MNERMNDIKAAKVVIPPPTLFYSPARHILLSIPPYAILPHVLSKSSLHYLTLPPTLFHPCSLLNPSYLTILPAICMYQTIQSPFP